MGGDRRQNAMSKDQIPNTTPQEQFRRDVLPPYEAYMTDRGTEWLARAAGNAVAHFAENVHKYYKYHDPSQLHGKIKRAEDFVKHLAATHDVPELKIVWDLALAIKHRFLKKNPETLLATTDTNAFSKGIIDPGARISSATQAFSERLVDSSTGSVVADTDTKRLWMKDCNRYFDDVLETAVDFWKDWLEKAPTYL